MQSSWLALATLLLAASAQAREVEYSDAYDACMEASGGVTASMIECLDIEIKAQDVALNTEYKALRASLTPGRKTELQAVQRAWIAYRDANCRFYADPDGGSLARVAANDCVLRETAARAAELRMLQDG